MIIQKSSKYQFDKPMIERIKGHTKIELTDVKTKHRKVIESDNTFQTDVLADKMLGGVFRYGAYDDVPYANGKTYFYSSVNLTELAYAQMLNTVGGIMLFDSEITVPSKYMPAGVKMVANGGYGVTNAANPPELGSYNTVESSLGNNSFQFVYDWGTSQGNGTIASICLTSRMGGLMGMGNPSNTASNNNYDPCQYQVRASRLSNLQSNVVQYGNALYMGGGSEGSAFDFTNKVLTLRKYTLNGIKRASIFDGRYTDLTFDFSALPSSYRLPSNTASVYMTTDGNGKIFIPIPYHASTWDYYIPDNTTGYYIELDCTTDTFTLKSVTNHTGYSVNWGSNLNGVMGCDGTNFLTTVYSNVTEILMNMSDGTLTKTLISGSASKQGFKFADNLWYCGQQDGQMYVYDATNDTIYPTNAKVHVGNTSFANSNQQLVSYVDNESGLIISSATSQVYAFYNPCFLSTINNLESSVTKDVSQTMKVTYTLTEV